MANIPETESAQTQIDSLKYRLAGLSQQVTILSREVQKLSKKS